MELERGKRDGMRAILLRLWHGVVFHAFTSWQNSVYTARVVGKMMRVRQGEILAKALFSWDAFIATEHTLLGLESKVLVKSLLSARRSVLRRWEAHALLQRRRAIACKRASDLWLRAAGQSRAGVFGSWASLCSRAAVIRERLAWRGRARIRALSHASWDAWVRAVTWENQALHLQNRLVCMWAVSCSRPVVHAWRNYTTCRKILRFHHHKVSHSCTSTTLKISLAHWCQAAQVWSRHRRCAERIRRSATAITLRASMVEWHRCAAERTLRNRLRARILLSTPRMGRLASQRADQSWHRSLLFDWLLASKAARGRARVERALALRCLWTHLLPVLTAWHCRTRLSNRVLELSNAVLMRWSWRMSSVILTAWRVVAVARLCSRDAWLQALNLSFEGRCGTQHRLRLYFATWRLAARHTRAVSICVASAHVRAHTQHGMYASLRSWSHAARDLMDTRCARESHALSRSRARACQTLVRCWAFWNRVQRRLRHVEHLCSRTRRARLATQVCSKWHRLSRFHAHLAHASDALTVRLPRSAVKRTFAAWLSAWQRASPPRHHAASVSAARYSSPLFPSS